jgi:hypothetical protein
LTIFSPATRQFQHHTLHRIKKSRTPLTSNGCKTRISWLNQTRMINKISIFASLCSHTPPQSKKTSSPPFSPLSTCIQFRWHSKYRSHSLFTYLPSFTNHPHDPHRHPCALLTLHPKNKIQTIPPPSSYGCHS